MTPKYNPRNTSLTEDEWIALHRGDYDDIDMPDDAMDNQLMGDA